MKILLIAYDNDSHISIFPLGLAYIASALRKDGHQVNIYEQDVFHYSEEHLIKYCNQEEFDAIGVGGCGGYYQYRKIKAISKAINELDKKPLFWLGGHLSSADPEYFLRKFNADFICIGEGEETVSALIKKYEYYKGGKNWKTADYSSIEGIAYLNDIQECIITKRRSTISQIDKIDWPAWDLFSMENHVLIPAPNSERKDRVMNMISGRGCPFHCNFCYRMDEGFRPRATEEIIKEMQYLKNTYSITYIEFDDELLMSSVSRTKEICRAMLDANLGMKWNCNGRLNYASKDKEMLQLMKEAGCVFINYGIESIDDEALKRMNKNLTVDMIVRGVENTLEAEISPGLNIIFGNLGETREILEKDVEFLLKYDDHAQCRTIRPVTPYPGTELYYYAIKQGLIRDIEDFYENKHTNSDLLTCNFTELSDEEFYEALFWANSVLLDNHIKQTERNNLECLNKLYKEKDASFRGFRNV